MRAPYNKATQKAAESLFNRKASPDSKLSPKAFLQKKKADKVLSKYIKACKQM